MAGFNPFSGPGSATVVKPKTPASVGNPANTIGQKDVFNVDGSPRPFQPGVPDPYMTQLPPAGMTRVPMPGTGSIYEPLPKPNPLIPPSNGELITRPVQTISARYGGETMGPPAPPPGTYPPVQNLSKGGENYDAIYTPGGTPTFSELLLSAAMAGKWGGWNQNPAAGVAEGVAAGGNPAPIAKTGGGAAIAPKATTFKGASSGRDYNVGQKYQGTNGYVYTAQPDGTFKQTGKPAGGGAQAYDQRTQQTNKGAGGYTSSGQSKTASDGTSWAANW